MPTMEGIWADWVHAMNTVFLTQGLSLGAATQHARSGQAYSHAAEPQPWPEEVEFPLISSQAFPWHEDGGPAALVRACDSCCDWRRRGAGDASVEREGFGWVGGELVRTPNR